VQQSIPLTSYDNRGFQERRYGILHVWVLSYLIVDMAMEGSGVLPLLNTLNCESEITSQVGMEDRPSNSSL
jgi:hypothetical protein